MTIEIRGFMTEAFQEQLALLMELQQIDVDLYEFKKRIETFPEELREVEEAYLAVKGDLDAAKAELAEVEKSKKTDESELAASVESLRNREAKLYAIKTNKEYQAALKEISEGKRINREREDRVLQSMEKIEALTQKITQLSANFADKEGAYKARKDEQLAEEATIREKMAKEEARRPELMAGIDKKVIRKYEFVRQRYARATSAVMNGVCQECSKRIPPQLFNEMLRRDELKSCPSCQRLIYVSEAPAVEEKQPEAAGN